VREERVRRIRTILFLGVRYQDDVSPTDDGWRISRRAVSVDWAHRALPAIRLSATAVGAWRVGRLSVEEAKRCSHRSGVSAHFGAWRSL